MNIATIKYCDIANGIGVRTSVFVSGCRHHCKNCFNEVAWDFSYGEQFTEKLEKEIIESLAPDYIKGISLLGGEPFEKENQKPLIELLTKIRERYKDKDVWVYSGFTYEELTGEGNRASGEDAKKLLSLCDVLVDGKFVEVLKDISLKFRGSSNQRVIDLNKTRESGEVTLLLE